MVWNTDFKRKLIARTSFDGLTPLLAVSLVACGGGGGGGGGSSSTGTPPPTSLEPIKGWAFNGPVEGAEVYIDQGTIGVFDEADRRIDTTREDGSFFIPATDGDKPLIVRLNGATNHADPNNPVLYGDTDLVWAAPAKSLVVSPLTHLIASKVLTEEEIEEEFGLPDVDLTKFNPYAKPAQTAESKPEDVVIAEQVKAAGEAVGEVLETVAEDAVGLTTEELKTEIEKVDDEQPTVFRLSTRSKAIDEGTVARQKLADIEITDDGLGTNTPRLAAGARRFEIVKESDGGYALYLKAGVLDYETAQMISGKIVLGASPLSAKGPDSGFVTYTLTVTDVDLPDPVTETDPNRPALAQYEFKPREYVRFTPDDVDDAVEPAVDLATTTPFDLLVRNIIAGSAWVMPSTGPLIISWRFDDVFPDDEVSLHDTDERKVILRSKLDAVFKEFEKHINVQFTEITEPDEFKNAYLKIKFIHTPDSTSADAFLPGDGLQVGGAELVYRLRSTDLEVAAHSLLVHEMGHALGLAHPFDADGGWPAISGDYFLGTNTIMSYALEWFGTHSHYGLQPADIAAFQLLYGSAGEDNAGILHHIIGVELTGHRFLDAEIEAGRVLARNIIRVAENVSTDEAVHHQMPGVPDGFHNSIEFSLPDGVKDNDLFTINLATGAIRFKQSPDFENPHDEAGDALYGRNNIYELIVHQRFDIKAQFVGRQLDFASDQVFIVVEDVPGAVPEII